MYEQTTNLLSSFHFIHIEHKLVRSCTAWLPYDMMGSMMKTHRRYRMCTSTCTYYTQYIARLRIKDIRRERRKR